MRPSTYAALLACLMIACAYPAKSQTDSAYDFLTIPVSPMLCREVPLTAIDSAAVAFEFVDARGAIERQTLFAFDSVGTPLYLTVQATFVMGPDGGGWAELAAVRFGPTAWGTHTKREFVPGQVLGDSTKIKRVPVDRLTADELRRARVLAEWIWKHRCSADREARPD